MKGPQKDTQPQDTIKAHVIGPRKNNGMQGEMNGGHAKNVWDDTHPTSIWQRASVTVSHTWPHTQWGQLTQQSVQTRSTRAMMKTADDDKEQGEKAT